MTAKDAARLIVVGNSQWVGDPRLGTFTVYLDGEKAGKVPPSESLRLTCKAGPHVLRVRQWWYLSRRTNIETYLNQELRLKAGFSRTGNVIARTLTGMFLPWRALSLTAVDDHG
jgi:hypothetical protein